LCLIKAPDNSILGLVIHYIQFTGAPAATAASYMILADVFDDLKALG